MVVIMIIIVVCRLGSGLPLFIPRAEPLAVMMTWHCAITVLPSRSSVAQVLYLFNFVIFPPSPPMFRLPLSFAGLRRLPTTPSAPTSSSTRALLDRGVGLPPSSPPGGDGGAAATLPRAATPAAFERRVSGAGAAQSSSTPRGSPTQTGAHPRRRDLPARAPTRTTITSRESLALAVGRLNRDKFAATSRKSYAARLSWWRRQRRAHGGRPWPLTIDLLQSAAAILKAQGYRTASQYLYALKRHHISLGFTWSDSLARELVDCGRSCGRGLGPAAQSQPLPLGTWAAGPLPPPGFLVSGIDVVLVGAWWLMREIELAGLLVQDVAVSPGSQCGTATLLLAVSKTDATAKGVRRTLGCCCPSALCPSAAVRRLLASTTGLAATDYVVRSLTGQPATKAEVVREIRHVGKLLGVTNGISGHSLRVTGAQRLALAGVAVPRITLFGRWASKAMVTYARESLLGARGGGLAEQVADVDFTERGLIALARSSTTNAPEAAVREFVMHAGAEPMGSLGKADLVRQWAQLADQAKAEHASASSSPPLPSLIRSRAGVIHKVVSQRITRCGWTWSSHDDIQAVAEGAVLTCRKCAGTRLRWGARRDRAAPA